MENTNESANRIATKLSVLRGAAFGNLSGENIGKSAMTAARIASPLTAAAMDELTPGVDRLAGKLSRDGFAKTAKDAARSLGSHVVEDLSSTASRMKANMSKAGQALGEVAHAANAPGASRKEPFTSLLGLAETGLRRAGLYSPEASARALGGNQK